MERFKMIASGYAFFVRGNTILLSCRKDTGYMDGWYSVPAGHIEDGESVTHGTCREVYEETGVSLHPDDIRLIHVMHRKSDDIRMDFFFFVEKTNVEPKNTEPEKCSDMQWFPMRTLPSNTIPYIKEAIKNFQKSTMYSEFGW